MTVATEAPRPLTPYDRADWASAFRNVTLELTDEPLQASRGSIPAELQGTLYRNGPGRLERGGQWVHHPFDGDGMVTALRFSPDGVFELRTGKVELGQGISAALTQIACETLGIPTASVRYLSP